MGRELFYECLLELLSPFLLNSLVLHVVSEDEMGEAHEGYGK